MRKDKNGDFLKAMGQRIKAIRESKGLYQYQLADLCNMHFGCISEIEAGKHGVQIVTLKKMADALEVDVKDFL